MASMKGNMPLVFMKKTMAALLKVTKTTHYSFEGCLKGGANWFFDQKN